MNMLTEEQLGGKEKEVRNQVHIECTICLWLKIIYNQGLKIVLFDLLSITILSDFSFSPAEEHEFSTGNFTILVTSILFEHRHLEAERNMRFSRRVILKLERESRSSGGPVETHFWTPPHNLFSRIMWVLRICICNITKSQVSLPLWPLVQLWEWLFLTNGSSSMAGISPMAHLED